MRDLLIVTGEEGKGRSFRATLLASVEADGMWDGGEGAGDVHRPIWAMLGAGEGDFGPFVANLRCGRKAEDQGRGWRGRDRERYEFLRSAGYAWAVQHHSTAGAAAIQVYLPDLFRHNVGMVDPEGVRFGVLPPLMWLEERGWSATKVDECTAHVQRCGTDRPLTSLESAIRLAPLVIGALSQRSRIPIPRDATLWAQVAVAALDQGLATMAAEGRFGYAEYGLSDVGLAPGLAWRSTHEQLETLMSEQVALYHRIRG